MSKNPLDDNQPLSSAAISLAVVTGSGVLGALLVGALSFGIDGISGNFNLGLSALVWLSMLIILSGPIASFVTYRKEKKRYPDSPPLRVSDVGVLLLAFVGPFICALIYFGSLAGINWVLNLPDTLEARTSKQNAIDSREAAKKRTALRAETCQKKVKDSGYLVKFESYIDTINRLSPAPNNTEIRYRYSTVRDDVETCISGGHRDFESLSSAKWSTLKYYTSIRTYAEQLETGQARTRQ